MRTAMAVLVACGVFAAGAARAGEPAGAKTATADVVDAKGASLGTVRFEQTPHGVLIKASLKGLPEGTHAFHIHETGKCEAPFKSAGGHFNPGHREHGILSAKGMHAGDMPNIEVPASGEAHFEVLNPHVSLEPGKPGFLFDADGSSLVIHAGVDDYKSNPAGNAGDRIACGVIQKQ
jgi:superoxide dismutase, Cu-Zn family